MKKVFLFLIMIACLILIPFYAIRLWSVISFITFENELHKAFWIAAAVSAIATWLFIKPGSFFAIFEHELTHLLWGLLFFKKPKGFFVEKDEGGHITLYGGNFLITLAPYFSLTFNLLLIPVYYLIIPSFFLYYYILFGACLGYHTSSTIKETHLGQSDLKKSGYIFSAVIIALGNILSYGMIIAFTIGTGEALWAFLKAGSLDAYYFIEDLIVSLT